MKLIIGKIDNRLTDQIKSEYPHAVLITKENQTTRVDVGYTGIEEFDTGEDFLNLLLTATEIFYYPPTDPTSFDIQNPTQTKQGYLEYLLFLAKQEGVKLNSYNCIGSEKTKNDSEQFLKLTDTRKKLSGPQLWCAGCSFTRGHGVAETDRYATLLSKDLNLPLNLLATSGSSISWAADQILRSDIRKGDIIVWGLTEKIRITYINNTTVTPFFASASAVTPTEKLLQRLFTEDELFLYYQLTSIAQVINFANKVGAKLLIVGLFTSISDLWYLQQFKYYYHYHYVNHKYKDVCDDGFHPGPLQHQEYAKKILEILRKRNYV